MFCSLALPGSADTATLPICLPYVQKLLPPRWPSMQVTMDVKYTSVTSGKITDILVQEGDTGEGDRGG